MKNQSTGKCPFEIVYTKPPCLAIDLGKLSSSVDLSSEGGEMVEKIVCLHREVQSNTKQANNIQKKVVDKHRRTSSDISRGRLSNDTS